MGPVDDDHVRVRVCTSWSTKAEEVDQLVADILTRRGLHVASLSLHMSAAFQLGERVPNTQAGRPRCYVHNIVYMGVFPLLKK